MFSVDRDYEGDMIRVWHMVQELSEQLAHNQKLVATLQSQANTLKVGAIQGLCDKVLNRLPTIVGPGFTQRHRVCFTTIQCGPLTRYGIHSGIHNGG